MKTNDRDVVTWAGLGVVGVTAIVWSFTALSDLAQRVGVTSAVPLPWPGWVLQVSWGLPITVDVLALVATRVWLRGVAPDEAVRYARRAAWGAIAATIAGNAYHGLLAGSWRVDALIVSAVPAVVIGVIVHLAVLAGRPVTAQPPDDRPTSTIDVEAAALYAAAQAERAGVGGQQAEAGGLPDRRAAIDVSRDGAVIGDLQELAGRSGRRYSRDEVKEMYGIGSDRAKRLLLLMGWFPRAAQADDQAEASAR